MPIDHKRINGPEVSVPYNIYTNSNCEEKCTKNNISERKDGRAHNERREIFLKTGIISQAKGSAYIEMGDTKVVCSVFDPREIHNKNDYCTHGELFCEFKFAPFSCKKRKIHQQDANEKEYSLILKRALEPAVCLHEFPNFQVDVYTTVLDNDGSSLAAAITVASLALANAGVPMFGLVTASTVAIYDDILLLDPTDTEELYCSKNSLISGNHGIIVQASLPQLEQISEFFLVGNLNMEHITNAIEVIKQANKDICPLLQQCLVKSVFKVFKEKERKKKEIK
ncbi:exosome complex component MTR3-like [Vespa mandarinia]|uniref:exosome complex component MTR3-like n=1 Tax=Vespa mandarinia TaxID=7446 RepID=UPI00161C16C6|nr:exosome complex component MTR3-like [Vespa mandarinia]